MRPHNDIEEWLEHLDEEAAWNAALADEAAVKAEVIAAFEEHEHLGG